MKICKIEWNNCSRDEKKKLRKFAPLWKVRGDIFIMLWEEKRRTIVTLLGNDAAVWSLPPPTHTPWKVPFQWLGKKMVQILFKEIETLVYIYWVALTELRIQEGSECDVFGVNKYALRKTFSVRSPISWATSVPTRDPKWSVPTECVAKQLFGSSFSKCREKETRFLFNEMDIFVVNNINIPLTGNLLFCQ